MTDTIQLAFDDEEDGGNTYWYETTWVGLIPRAGDHVYSHDTESDENGLFEVVRVVWMFVQRGSYNANRGLWGATMRIQVKRVREST